MILHGWQLLPSNYRNHPLFVIDSEIPGLALRSPASSMTTCNDVAVTSVQFPSSPNTSITVEGDSVSMQCPNEIAMTSQSNCADPQSGLANDDVALISGSVTTHSSADASGLPDGHSLQEIAKAQSVVRRLLSRMTAYTYGITNIDFWMTQLARLKEQLANLKKMSTAGRAVRAKRRFRIGKKIGMGSCLKQRLQMLRTRKRHRKIVRQQRKTSRCYVFVLLLAVYFHCVNVCNVAETKHYCKLIFE